MSWPDVKLKDVCELAIDCVNKTAPYVDYETPYKMLRTTNVRGGFVDVDSTRFVTEEIFEKWTRRSVPKKGDVILTREAPLGDVGRLTSNDNVFLGQRLFLYRADPEVLDSLFLAYVLQSPIVQGRFRSKGFGATVQHAKVGDCENLTIPLPDLDLQNKIGKLLANYDDLIENNRRRIQLLEESAHLLYKEWFVHLRFPGHEHVKIVDGIPEGWNHEPLGNLMTLQRGFDLPTKSRKFGTVPIYASTGINGYHSEAKVKGPGVVTGRSGSLGTVMYVAEDHWPLNTTLWVKNFNRVSPIFSVFVLRSIKLSNYNGGAAVPTLNRNDVHKILVLRPPEKLISEFDLQVETVFQKVKMLKKYNKKLAQARDLLLPRLMNGTLAV